MISARVPSNECERLNILRAYELLDTEPEEVFDAMTRLASNLCRAPIALVSLIDEKRQWFKSSCGLEGVTSTGRNVSFCAHAILEQGIFEIPDARKDPRFADNSLVTGDPHVVFYCGVPLIEPGGMALGTLCVIDHKPRRLTKAQKLQLTELAKSVVGLIVMRIRRSEMDAFRLTLADNKRTLSRLKKHSNSLKVISKSANATLQGRTAPSAT
jgi:GAF domain-containing protein